MTPRHRPMILGLLLLTAACASAGGGRGTAATSSPGGPSAGGATANAGQDPGSSASIVAGAPTASAPTTSAPTTSAPPAAGGAGAAPATRAIPRATVNDPSGDFFVGTDEERGRIVDGYVADASLAGPIELFLAANTAERLGRLEDACFFFYAAQLRASFEHRRRKVRGDAPGMQYLGFLNRATWKRVNTIGARQPNALAAAIARLDRWEIIPAPEAPLEEFEASRAFAEPADRWPAMARALRQEFMSMLGKIATLLGDRDFAEAYQCMSAHAPGKVARSRRTYQACLARARQLERARFPGSPPMF